MVVKGLGNLCSILLSYGGVANLAVLKHFVHVCNSQNIDSDMQKRQDVESFVEVA